MDNLDIQKEFCEHVPRIAEKVTPEKAGELIELMDGAFPEAMVTGYEKLVGVEKLPDSKDDHVLACAIRSRAQVIVTEYLKDFPEEIISKYDIEAQHPDQFLAMLHSLNPELVTRIILDMVEAYDSPPIPTAEFLDSLDKSGLIETSLVLSMHID